MASLTNTKIKNTYPGLLKTTDNAALGGTYKLITDGLGNSSGVYLGTGGRVGIGDVPDVNSKLRISGGGIDVEGSSAIRLRFFNGTTFQSGIQAVLSAGDMIQGSQSGDLAIRNQSNLLFASGGNTERMRINSSGNVGIGTTDPQKLLHLAASGANSTIRIQRTNANTTGAFGALQWCASDNHSVASIVAYADGNNEGAHLSFRNTSAASSGDPYGMSERMRIDSSGNVGIGVSSPAVPLHVQGFARFVGGIQLEGNNRTIYATSNTNLLIGTNNTERMRIDSSGNVGINDSSPSYLFNIKGTEERIGIKDSSAGETWDNTDLGGFVFRTHYATQEKTGMYAVGLPHGTGVNFKPQLEFKTSNTTRLTINPNGNVGIGDTNPGAKLVVAQPQIISGGFSTPFIELKSTSQTDNTGLVAMSFSTSTADNYGYSIGALRGSSGGASSFVISHHDNSLSGTERMRIDSSGNVGINYTNPQQKLEVSGAARFSRTNLESSQYIEFIPTSSGNTLKAVGDDKSLIFDNTSSTNNFIDFRQGGQNKMRLKTGNLLIGKTSFGTNTAGIELNPGGLVQATRSGNLPLLVNRLSSDGTIVSIRKDNVQRGSISVSGSTTSYNTTSDYRLKQNVVDMTGALNRVEQLQPKRFNFISEKSTVDGFIAHEVQSVIPEAISGEKDAVDDEGNPDYQGIDQSKIVPLLVGAIKELKAEIETLKSQINS